MKRKYSKLYLLSINALLLGLTVSCSGAPSAQKTSAVYSPPNTSFAKSLKDISSPVTQDQAKAIAEAAAGGVASIVEQEDMNGAQVYGVLVTAGTIKKDVKVRISDGAVLQIDTGDGVETAGSEGDESKD